MSAADEKDPARRAVLGWCFYDFATSAFSTLVVSTGYSLYFKNVVAAGAEGDRLWGIASSLSVLCVAVLSPWLGAMGDLSGSKMRFLRTFTWAGVAATALLAWTGSGSIAMGMLLFGLANASLAAGAALCNAFLSEVAPPESRGRVSARAWAFGYLGGGVLAPLVALPLLRGGLSSPEGIAAYRWTFPLVGAWILLFTLPTFLWVREHPVSGPAGTAASFRLGWRRVASTLRDLKRYRSLALFLAAYFLFIDGIDTLFGFAALVAQESFGFPEVEILWLFIAANGIGAAGTALLGGLADRVGDKRLIAGCLASTLAILSAVAFCHGKAVFWAAALALASLLGAIQSASRALVARLSPSDRQAEFFGFFSFMGRMGAVLGPLLFGMISARANQRCAIGVLLLLIGAGWILLRRVDVARGEREAQTA